MKVGSTLAISSEVLNLASGIATAGTAGQSTASSGYTLSVPYVTVDTYGRVTGYGTHTHTVSNIPNSSLTNSSITVNGTLIFETKEGKEPVVVDVEDGDDEYDDIDVKQTSEGRWVFE